MLSAYSFEYSEACNPGIPVQNTSYLTFPLPPITFPHAETTCLFHKYTNPLALGDRDLRLVLPSQLPSL